MSKRISKKKSKNSGGKKNTLVKETATAVEVEESVSTSQEAVSKSKTESAEEESIRITEMDMYLFGQATHYHIYEKMGAHETVIDGKKGIYFSVWAPKAMEVYLIGTFNNWNETSHPMTKLGEIGIYDIFVEEARIGDLYKFLIISESGDKLYKADPYANSAELRPGTASKVAEINRFHWTDSAWMKARETKNNFTGPMAIYEVHPGSWKKHIYRDDSDEDKFYNYRELAEHLTTYVKEMGYTHVELMGIAEHPFDGSWGYQVTGYYAPTSRYGTPEDFMYLVDYLHKNKIGVILDWVPAHFPRDAHGLSEFDGSCVYEYSDKRKGEHPDWGTKIFDYSKNEVKNFLIANALFWVEKFHVDGLRVDAVASMLYLDYGKQDGEWLPNEYGGNKNLEAIEFFKHMNSCLLGRNHGAIMIAEESTAWPAVTGRPEDDGLGFSLKWNMGWMHDFLDYMKLDPYFRKDNHNRMTFAMSYAYAENYILVLSHDEVVHLKCSMFNKMPGSYREEKLANLKAGYAFMFGHPGKKLLFMGQDFGQEREWSEKREIDWFLLEEPVHRQLHDFVKELLKLYNGNPCMYEMDTQVEGFEWINADDNFRSIFSFVRHSADGKNNLLFVCNFTPVEREDYRVGVPESGTYTLVLDSDEERFGGSGVKHRKTYKAEEQDCDNREYSIAYKLSAFGVAVFKF
ncbi:MAG: 1,4-alpha-glucan branching protein GlgB [Lachnospiraceae bacterium]|nr:1,4-alpha-glucan branching protein GlgB [Lachnospiraceae bacterium]